jgi:hypothetical protein
MVERAAQGVCHEAQSVEEVALAGPVRPHQEGERAELHVAAGDALIVLQENSGDEGRVWHGEWQARVHSDISSDRPKYFIGVLRAVRLSSREGRYYRMRQLAVGALILLLAIPAWPQHASVGPALPSITLPPELDRVLRGYERTWRAHDAAAEAGYTSAAWEVL